MAVSEPPILYEHSVEITIGEFIDNIEKNGWTQSFGEVFNGDAILNFKVDREKVTEACAFGQGMLNSDIYIFDDPVMGTPYWRKLYKDISHWNDEDRLDIPTIARLARIKYEGVLDTVLHGWNYEDYINERVPGTPRGMSRG